MQIKDGVGSLLNPRPWFGFRWENLSGIDAKGLLFSANVGKLDIQTISAFQFEDLSDARRFILSWRENDRKEPDSKSPRTPIPGRNNEARWYTNQSTQCHLLQIDKLILVSTSEIHLKEWLQDAIARGVWTSKTDTAADVELKAFEQSNHTGVRFWLRPQQFANHWSKSMRPSATAWTKATLPSLQSVAGTLFVPNDEGSWTVEYHVQLQKNLQSVAKLLSFTSDKPIEIPGLDFSQAETWTMSNVDIKDWFEGFCQSMNIAIDPKIPGMFDDIIDAILTDPEGPKVDLKKDLFHRLKPSIAVVSKSTFEPIGNRNRDYLWLFELDSGVDAVKLADKLFEEDDIVEKESVGDYSVWFTRGDAPLLTSATTGSGRQIQSLACGPKYLIACSNKDWLTEVLMKSTPEHTPFFSLSQSWSKRLEPQAREPRSLLQGIDSKKAFRLDWEHVQNAERQTLMATAFLDLVLGGTSYAHKTKDLVPTWTSVHNCFGILSHSLIRTSDTLNGSIVVDDSN
ncbi:MAG: hypothetical protein FJ308_02090 [Planctomycetes bacterium]|nr:hypothetical protein [Planctomycetota bacterium]